MSVGTFSILGADFRKLRWAVEIKYPKFILVQLRELSATQKDWASLIKLIF